MAQQKETIKIPKGYSRRERKAIAEDIVEFIIDRTRDENRDKNGKRFKGYSKSYKESLDFKIGGKSSGNINLTLSGEMLDSLDVLTERVGAITIGYDKDDKELNGKVEGNRKGTYGNKKAVGPKRDFLGISQRQLNKILKEYPLNDDEARAARLLLSEETRQRSSEILGETEFEITENEDA